MRRPVAVFSVFTVAAILATSLATATRAASVRAAPTGSSAKIAVAVGGRLWVMDTDGSHLKAVTPLTVHGRDFFDVQAPAWSPDGRVLAFSAEVGLQAEIYAVDEDGTRLRQLTHLQHDSVFEPAWSPDGQRIAFVATPSPLTATRIDVMNADGSGVKQLTASVGNTDNSAPSWSADGRTIFYACDNHQGLCSMNADGSDKRAIWLQPIWLAHGAISPDGHEIVYSSPFIPSTFPHTSGPKSAIYVAHIDATGARRLTSTTGEDALAAAWSPDGRELVVVKEQTDNKTEIWEMGANGSNQRRIASLDGASFGIAWQHR